MTDRPTPDRGPPVPDGEMLHRVIVPGAAAVWCPGGVLSSAAFSFPVFSADIAGLSEVAETLARWPAGSGIAGFSCSAARGLGFDPRHEPEHGNAAHANVYSSHSNSERKRQARRLASVCTLVVQPTRLRDLPP